MRRKMREWKNGKYPQWDGRIQWFEGPSGIRLSLQDCDRSSNFYPTSKEQAEYVWGLFKEHSTIGEPCVTEIIAQAEAPTKRQIAHAYCQNEGVGHGGCGDSECPWCQGSTECHGGM